MKRRASGPKRVVVTDAALKAAGARATKASAKLEGHEVPDGHQRTAAVAAYIAKQRPPDRDDAAGLNTRDHETTDPAVPSAIHDKSQLPRPKPHE